MTRLGLGSGPRMTVPRLDDSPIPPVSPDRRRRAALVVCGRAGDSESARTVLEALGLIDDPAIAGALDSISLRLP
jgi:hypothetical protein